MTIELNNNEIDSVGGGLRIPIYVVCQMPAPFRYEPSPTFDPGPVSPLKD